MNAPSRDDAIHRAHDVAGWSDGEQIVRLILSGSDRVVAGVSGPGGSGKSTLLQRMAAELRAGGARVVHGTDPGPAEDGASPVVMLVDDAEQLGPAELAVLDGSVDDVAHLVVAFRPTPASPVANVFDHAGRRRPVVTLHPLAAAEIADRWTTLMHAPPEAGRVDRVLELTHGNPRLVDLVLVAIRDEGWDLDTASDLPGPLLTYVSTELDALDRDTREFVLALAIGFSTSGPALATAPRFAGADTLALVQGARAAGLAAADGALCPLVRSSVLRTALPDEAWSLRRELVDAMAATGTPLEATAMSLADDGFRDARLAGALEQAGDELLPTDPAGAARRYAAAVAAGADRTGLQARRAHAAWAAGDVRDAERLVDRLLARADSPDMCRGVEVAAAVWARQGLLHRSAVAYERLASDRCALAPLAVVCLVATGEPERAVSLRTSGERIAYPTSSYVALDLMADGILRFLDGDHERALAFLLNASSLMSEAGPATVLPEVPAVLAAQVGLVIGELAVADGVLSAAIEGGQGGPAFTARLLLTRGLVALRADRPRQARAHLVAAMADAAMHPIGLRDELLASALRVGLARHQGEIPLLLQTWREARPALAGMRPDLTILPALAELVLAAARLDEMHLVESRVDEARALIERVGADGPLSTALHWTEIEAALLRNDPGGVEDHARVLSTRGDDRIARRLADAARTWASALGGNVDVEGVERAARELESAGYPWDAARLAGHAAARAAEHQDSLRLLALARSLHPDETPSDRDASGASLGAAGSPGPEPSQDDSALSAREREVARLVLEGKTYVEIGETIFISPRTAEHHIARIRRKLGATNRSDLIAKLRSALGE
ncbi:LuxR C-terminal-related transcriptional regulator [Agromyces bracchium]|uniref:LuxR family transcriptional regulator n=1 Tax=Agromyces bracchium TaxID=88376 RepID=A0A6I3MFB6_9MICO|nr:LuxR C-terminal-related transcriptional regulator [Agromyces bracchium]MTH68983.1 LuxR family transcriptional regulator [Agromyces bracchium]